MIKINPHETAIAAVKQILLDAAGSAVAKGLLPAEPIPGFAVEIPGDTAHGDLACNLALVSAKTFHNNPRAIAQILADEAQLEDSLFSKIEVAGPGFLNFFYHDRYYAMVLESALGRAEDYGRTTAGEGQKMQVEFVSANPTGPMHLGNARGGAIGDVLASILDWSGYEVTREFYINDAGNQIQKFANSLAGRYHQLTQPDYPFSEDYYQGQDIIEHAKAFAAIHGTDYLSDDEEALQQALVDYALPLNIDGLKRDLATYGIEYDVWFRESSLYADGTVDLIMKKLEDNGATYEKEGAIWLNTSKYLKELYLQAGKTEEEIERLELKDDVLRRSNGFYTYFAADIAYHYNKFQIRGYDHVINVWGADHHGHVARLKAALNAVGLDSSRLDIVLMQLVELVRDGEKVRMSKRTGKAITLTDLLEEVPIDAARFFFNLREPNSHFEFDLSLASKQEKDNPVYYVQYAHARLCSILRALNSDGYATSMDLSFDSSCLQADEERTLLRKLASFPSEIVSAGRDFDPSRITRYAVDVATLFHRFYTVCRVKDAENADLTAARTALCLATKQVIANTLSVLGIHAPDVM